jgi:hypothetical protein
MSASLTLEEKRNAIRIKNDLRARDYSYTGTGGDGNYCKHGVNLGYWDGPDYMCGARESGVSDYEYALGLVWNERRRARREVSREFIERMFMNRDSWWNEHVDLFDREESKQLVDLMFRMTKIIENRR